MNVIKISLLDTKVHIKFLKYDYESITKQVGYTYSLNGEFKNEIVILYSNLQWDRYSVQSL